MPEVRGTAEPHGGAYPLSSPPPRTPSRDSSLPHCGPAGRNGRVTLIEANARFAPFLCGLRPRECICRGPRFCTIQPLVTDNCRAPQPARATRRLLLEGRICYAPFHRVSGSEPLRLRTHRLCDRSRPLLRSVIE